ncbi:alpha/beta fold hydrolase [Paraburkholderia guartelaensis]|uniref:alpha/beta fold hydrolase n=1 Tax=Paraburkholderia guartelaensis TaxID=2546446 RepID=UPI002AB6DA81|nr:alpha/beta fold hydrolase [Paraburkholderia guartelaensis]
MTTQQLDRGAHRIAFRDEGDGLPVLCLHSLAGSLRMWDGAARVLARHYRVLRCDARGHGASTGTVPYTVEGTARDALALLDALGIARYAVLGISMGGQAAMHLALAAPHRVAALVLANTSAGALPDAQGRLAQTKARIEEIGYERFAAEYVASRFADGYASRGYADYLREALALGAQRYVATLRSILAQDLSAELWRLRVPVLLISGTADVSTTPERMRALGALLPTSRTLELEGAGHFSCLDQPAQFIAGALEFFSSNTKES